MKKIQHLLILLFILQISPLAGQKVIITGDSIFQNNVAYDTVIIENGGTLLIGKGGMQVRKLMQVNPGGKILGGYLRMHGGCLLANNANDKAIDSLDISLFGSITIGGSSPSVIRKFLVGWHGRSLTLQNKLMIKDTFLYSVSPSTTNCPVITNGNDLILGKNMKWFNAGKGSFVKLSGGKIIRYVSPGEEVFIPAGDANGQSNLQFNLKNSASDFSDSARVEITLTSGNPHPEALGLITTDYLTRNFGFKAFKINNPSFDAGFYYNTTDVHGQETIMKSAYWNGTVWQYGPFVNSQNHFLSIQNVALPGDLTAGDLLKTDIRPCPAPQKPDVAEKSFTSFTLDWNKVNGALSYVLSWRKNGTSDWTNITGITDTLYTISGLTDSTTYEIRIQSACDVNQKYEAASVFSDPVSVTTVYDNGCYPPENLFSSFITDKEATLSWKAVLPTPDRYRIEYRVKNALNWEMSGENPSDTFLILKGLIPATEYQFRLKTVCSTGVESLLYSGIKDFITLQACQKPTGLSAENTGIGSMHFAWTGAGNNTSFILRYKAKTASNWIYVPVTTGSEINLTGLSEGTLFQWELGGICTALGDTVYTAGQDILSWQNCDEVPTGLLTESVASTGAVISWQNIAGISNYEIKYRKEGTTEWTEKTGSSNPTARLFNLEPATDYEWSVRTYCQGSSTRSEFATPVKFKTLPGSPTGSAGINPVAQYYDGPEGFPAWTNKIRWNNIIDMSTYASGSNDFEKFENARDEAHAAGGGVLYYPAGTYDFTDAPCDGPEGRGLMLKTGIIILGETPDGKPLAKDGNLPLQTVFRFKYHEKESGKWVPADWNLIGIMPSPGEELKDVNLVGIAWVKLEGACIYFGPQFSWGNTYATAGAWKSSKVKTSWANRKPDGTFPFDPFAGAPLNTTLYEGAGKGRLVFGCQFENSTIINNVINEGFGETGYFVYKFGSRIGVYGSDVFIANNRISKPTKCFKYNQTTSGGSKTIVFDYADVTSIDVNKMYMNIASNRLSESGGYWEKGVIVQDNWFYNHGRKGMDASGQWFTLRNNHNERDFLLEGDDVYGLGGGWELTLDGYSEAGGASDNEARAYDLAGKALWIDGNSWNNSGSNPGNDGESILCQSHGGTNIHSWAVTHNFYDTSYNESKKGYLSGYDVHNYGMLVAWNDTKGSVGNLNAKDGDHLIDCAFIPTQPQESLVINGSYATLDTLCSCPQGALPIPGQLTVTAVEDSSYIRIEWKDTGEGEIGFRVDRREAGKNLWTTMAYRPRKSLGHPDNEQRWIDFLPVPGIEYEYRVVALNCEDSDAGASSTSTPAMLRIQVETPYFSLLSGTYNEAKDIEIFCSTPKAEIRYTLDGSEPNASSSLFAGAIHVDKPVVIKARAYLGNNIASEISNLELTILTSTANFAQHKIHVYPNPARSEVYVNLSGNEILPVKIQLIDLSGRKVYEQEERDQVNLILHAQPFARGIYYLKICTVNEMEWTNKLVLY